jgi:hypothetical protein
MEHRPSPGISKPMNSAPSNVRRKRRRGRPSKLTKAVGTTIIRAVRAGVFLETAAEIAGISPRSIFTWMAKGKKEPGSRHGRFFAGVKEGLANAEFQLVQGIARHGEKRWTALAWLLQRRFPKHWARRRAFQARPSVTHDPPPESPEMVLAEIERVLERREAAARALGNGSGNAGVQ